MTLQELTYHLKQYVNNSSENQITEARALRPELAGIKIFDNPLLGCASADDPIFDLMKNDPQIYGNYFRLPYEWLKGAKSVISFFLPYAEEIKVCDREGSIYPSDEWLHARIEGQEFLLKAASELAGFIEDKGYHTFIPVISSEFSSQRDDVRIEKGEPLYLSNWSERHIAYAAGLGTFGLSKQLITEKGVCGRFGSIITDAIIEATPRKYTQPYEYCIFCGECAARCPVNSMTSTEKDNRICGDFIKKTGELFAPRYGCGKCQIGVTCEKGIPNKI